MYIVPHDIPTFKTKALRLTSIEGGGGKTSFAAILMANTALS